MRGPDGRFLRGYSPNPGGRPRKYPDANASLVELLSKPVTIKQNGVERELAKREAMLMRAVQEVLKRNPGVRIIKLVLNALIELQVARHKRAAPEPPRKKCYVIEERDSDNAFEAMCLLQIAEPNPDYPEEKSEARSHDGAHQPPNCSRILLKPWAVAAAEARGPACPNDPDWSMKLRQHTASSNNPFSHGRP